MQSREVLRRANHQEHSIIYLRSKLKTYFQYLIAYYIPTFYLVEYKFAGPQVVEV